MITFLRQNKTYLAKNVYENDGDKICGIYPDIDELICKNLNLKPRYPNPGWNYEPIIKEKIFTFPKNAAIK